MSAVELNTNNSNMVTITIDKGRLPQAEIDRMIIEAELYNKEEEQKKIAVKSRNALLNYCYRLVHLKVNFTICGSRINPFIIN